MSVELVGELREALTLLIGDPSSSGFRHPLVELSIRDVVVHKAELEFRCTTDQILSACDVFHTGKLNDDAVFTLRVDLRLGDTEFINTVTDNFNGALDCCGFHLSEKIS